MNISSAHRFSTMSNSSVFPFFRLPRELRDDIYKKTGGQKRNRNVRLFESVPGTTSKSNSVSAHEIIIHNHPLESLQLVSKAFKEEYEEEIYCHTRLELVAEESKKLAISLSYLSVSEGLLKSISKIPELIARLLPPKRTKPRDYFGVWTEINEEAIRVLLPYMPKCKRVFCDVVFNFEAWSQPFFESTARAYAKAPAIASDLKYEQRIFVAGELYHMWEGYVPDESTLQKIPKRDWPAFRERLQKMITNRVYCRAYLDDGPYAIHGWRLEMSTPWTACVTLDMDRVFRMIEEARKLEKKDLKAFASKLQKIWVGRA